MAKRGPYKQSTDRKYPDSAGDIRFDYTRLINRAETNLQTGCWEITTGARHRQGYPMLGAFRTSDNKKIMTTGHRAVLKYKLQTDLKNQEAIHTCSNPLCVNPDHLFAGTHSDNMRQMQAKGRAPRAGHKGPYGPRGNRRQANRSYRYTDEQLIYFYHHTPQEIHEQYPEIKLARCYKLRWSVRSERGYRWLREKYPEIFTDK